MQLKAIVATVLLPLLAVADDPSALTTLTSTMTMTKTITIAKAAMSSVSLNATSTTFHPTGTGSPASAIMSGSGSASHSGSPTGSSPVTNPTTDKGNGAGSLSAFGFAGVAGMAVAALL
ncbi:hypothetical protein GGS21DRAFT_488146 [Xylaria nigripes]|nr:hypothetical protein GGS21DRAFT_488146 [Xylaria nigripes]